MTTLRVLALGAPAALLALYCSVSGAQSGDPMCQFDSDCSDGNFCNGIERCVKDGAGTVHGCAASSSGPCSSNQFCDEAADTCRIRGTDADGDGAASVESGGDDCDDADGNRFPGNAEVPDTLGHDEDCNPTTYAGPAVFELRPTPYDEDRDGYISSAIYNIAPDGQRFGGSDCDDHNADVHPTEAEICNGIDDNCDGRIDEDLPLFALYPDADGDGFGKSGTAPIKLCGPTPGLVANANDCDDSSPAVFPGTSVCNGKGGTSYCAPNGEMKTGACETGSYCMSQPSGSGVCVPMKPAPQSLK